MNRRGRRAVVTHRIIIDTDPGQDDAIAILLALASPEIEVLGICSVAGNVPLALTQENARKVVELAGRRDLPVHAGAERPLVREPVTAEYVHGATGLDGADLPAPSVPLSPVHAVDAIIDLLHARAPDTVTFCPLGPLTNIALALLKAPDIVGRIREIVLMGGAILTESTFGLKGVGFEAVNAVEAKDLPVILGVTLVMSLAIAVANLVVDMMYAVIDPRVRLG